MPNKVARVGENQVKTSHLACLIFYFSITKFSNLLGNFLFRKSSKNSPPCLLVRRQLEDLAWWWPPLLACLTQFKSKWTKLKMTECIFIQLPLTNSEGTNPPNPPAVLNLRLIEAVALELPSWQLAVETQSQGLSFPLHSVSPPHPPPPPSPPFSV